MKIRHPPLIPPIKGGKVPSPLVGEGLGEGYFRTNTRVIERFEAFYPLKLLRASILTLTTFSLYYKCIKPCFFNKVFNLLLCNFTSPLSPPCEGGD